MKLQLIGLILILTVFPVSLTYANILASEKLLEAIKELDVSMLDVALSEGADINDPNIDGHGRSSAEWLAMDVLRHFYSSEHSMLDVRDFAKELLARGMTISSFDKVLFSPISVGDLELVKILVENGANVNLKIDGFTPHQIAVKYDHPHIAQYLITAGARATTKTDMLQLQMTEAVSNNELEKLKEIIHSGAKINKPDPTGSTALVQILRMGIYEKKQYEIVEYLVENGADPNLQGDANFGKDLEGIPLNLMVYMSQAPMSDSKLKDKNRRKEANKYSVKAFKLLLDKGAHVSSKDSFDRTPLHFAAKQNNLKAAEILIDYGAKIMPKDKSLKTPLDYAESSEMIKLLKKNGAVEN